MRTVREVGIRRIARYAMAGLLVRIFSILPSPPLRLAFLRLLGARLGRGSIVGRVRFINADRGGFRAIRTGECVYIGDEVLIDLAGGIDLGDHVTIAARANLATHLNVGYRDHPLQAAFPSRVAPIAIGSGCFIGISATILPGVRIGDRSFVAAGAVVDGDVAPDALVGGVPAKVIRILSSPGLRERARPR